MLHRHKLFFLVAVEEDVSHKIDKRSRLLDQTRQTPILLSEIKSNCDSFSYHRLRRHTSEYKGISYQ